ncbi:MAG TPA: alpha/beta hydrolase [Candidatus Kapabacteria bacterium]|nr:alpha/beta hydrolase [Candidatus Kapabacteria bacterium]
MNNTLLVILPGWGGSHETWQQFILAAEKDYRVVCIDLPCFGSEPCPTEVWGVEEYAHFVVKKLQLLRTPVTLLGHSFGGQVAAYIAATHPELLNKLILSGAAAIRPKKYVRRLFLGALAKISAILFYLPYLRSHEKAIKKLLYTIIQTPDYGKTSGIQRDIFKRVTREDLRHLLPSITVPTLVVWGRKDRQTPLRHGRTIAALIPDAKLRIIPDGTHGLHLHHTEQLLQFVHEFIVT